MRFTTPDAIKEADDFLVHNIYAYTRNNPVNYVDPTGFLTMQHDGGRGVSREPIGRRVTGTMKIDSARGAVAPRRVGYRKGPYIKPPPATRSVTRQRTGPYARGPDGGRPVPVKQTKPVVIPGRTAMAADGVRGYGLSTIDTRLSLDDDHQLRGEEFKHEVERLLSLPSYLDDDPLLPGLVNKSPLDLALDGLLNKFWGDNPVDPHRKLAEKLVKEKLAGRHAHNISKHMQRGGTYRPPEFKSFDLRRRLPDSLGGTAGQHRAGPGRPPFPVQAPVRGPAPVPQTPAVRAKPGTGGIGLRGAFLFMGGGMNRHR